MEQIVIKVKDRQKADLLVQFLEALDFVDNVSSTDVLSSDTDGVERVDEPVSQDFFAMAGLWAGREITLATLRQSAWPLRS